MSTHFLKRLFRSVLPTLLILLAGISPSLAQKRNQGKILGGYFKEWKSITAHTILPICKIMA